MATKAKRKKTAVNTNTGDHGTLERRQHGDVVVIEETMVAGVKRARVTSQTMLDRYLSRGQLAPAVPANLSGPERARAMEDAANTAARRFDAGRRLYEDWRASGLEPTVVAGYGERLDRGEKDPAAHRYRAYRAAIQAVGMQLSPILLHVVLLDRPAAEWVQGRGYGVTAAQVSGMPILHLALDSLCAYYRL